MSVKSKDPENASSATLRQGVLLGKRMEHAELFLRIEKEQRHFASCTVGSFFICFYSIPDISKTIVLPDARPLLLHGRCAIE